MTLELNNLGRYAPCNPKALRDGGLLERCTPKTLVRLHVNQIRHYWISVGIFQVDGDLLHVGTRRDINAVDGAVARPNIDLRAVQRYPAIVGRDSAHIGNYSRT